MALLLPAGAMGQHTVSVSTSPPSRFFPVGIQDLENNPTPTPCIGDGQHVTMIIYADPDNYKQNEYFIERIKRYVFPLTEFCGYGVVNMKETFLPNFMLRLILKSIRNRSELERKAVILLDPDRHLAREWKLGNCNNQVAIILLDKAGNLIFHKTGVINEAETTHAINLITSRVSTYSLRESGK